MALISREPFSIPRHRVGAVRREVETLLAAATFDVIHAEQLQALPQADPGRARGVPVVVRAQNVESDLWRSAAGMSRGPRRWWVAREATRLARWEGAAVRRAAATLALTGHDAQRLRELAGGEGRVEVVPAPFAELPRAGSAVPGVPGRPAVVLMGSGGWLPNEDAVRWFVSTVWPRVASRLPEAVLHLFGGPSVSGERIAPHPPPRDSSEAFAPGSVQVVPLRIASGVRMKVLEAWARGIAVVGTREGLSGLVEAQGDGALIADDAEQFAAAFARLVDEPGLAEALCAAGRRMLRERHDPAAIAARMTAIYAEVRR
jgi:hypothetical protein